MHCVKPYSYIPVLVWGEERTFCLPPWLVAREDRWIFFSPSLAAVDEHGAISPCPSQLISNKSLSLWWTVCNLKDGFVFGNVTPSFFFCVSDCLRGFSEMYCVTFLCSFFLARQKPPVLQEGAAGRPGLRDPPGAAWLSCTACLQLHGARPDPPKQQGAWSSP